MWEGILDNWENSAEMQQSRRNQDPYRCAVGLLVKLLYKKRKGRSVEEVEHIYILAVSSYESELSVMRKKQEINILPIKLSGQRQLLESMKESASTSSLYFMVEQGTQRQL